MPQIHFNCLHTVRLEHEGGLGSVDLCREPDGTGWIRLRLTNPLCQREFLEVLDPTVPVRLEHGVLELLLPWQEGTAVNAWLYSCSPTLGQRRDACLALLQQLLENRGRLPPCLTVLSAKPENLSVGQDGIFLQYLPALRDWQPGMTEAQAVCAAAAAIGQVLAPEPNRPVPDAVQLLLRRQAQLDYSGWDQLQRDLASVPDEPSGAATAWRTGAQRIFRRLHRFEKLFLYGMAGLLLVAALLSLLSAYRQQRRAAQLAWPGMYLAGNQDLRNAEDSK